MSQSQGDAMNGQNPNNNKNKSHGLRLIKGGGSIDGNNIQTSEPPEQPVVTLSAVPKKSIRNPLLTQLSALADAIDNDVKNILKL